MAYFVDPSGKNSFPQRDPVPYSQETTVPPSKKDQPCFLVVAVVITGMTTYRGRGEEPYYNHVVVQSSPNLREHVFVDGDGTLEDIASTDFRAMNFCPRTAGVFILRGTVDELSADDETSDYPVPQWEMDSDDNSSTGYRWVPLTDEQAVKVARGQVLS